MSGHPRRWYVYHEPINPNALSCLALKIYLRAEAQSIPNMSKDLVSALGK